MASKIGGRLIHGLTNTRVNMVKTLHSSIFDLFPLFKIRTSDKLNFIYTPHSWMKAKYSCFKFQHNAVYMNLICSGMWGIWRKCEFFAANQVGLKWYYSILIFSIKVFKENGFTLNCHLFLCCLLLLFFVVIYMVSTWITYHYQSRVLEMDMCQFLVCTYHGNVMIVQSCN